MEGYILLVLLVIGVPILLVIWLIVRAVSAKNSLDELSRRLGVLELELYRLKREQPAKPQPEAAPVAQQVPPTPVAPAAPAAPLPKVAPREPALPSAPPVPAAPPPIPKPAAPTVAAPSPIAPRPPVAEPPRPRIPAVNWEQFMGVKLFAWVGGLALFLGVAFFVKYSFDNNLVPPELRVAIGFLAGLGLLVGGVVMSRKNYPALSQTLCATGSVVLYAVTFACRSVYHFAFFGQVPTFLLMVLITAAAFLLAVRLNALVVAVLGMLGGFLTPILLSTGQDNPLGLFGYIAILDIGLILVALNRRWDYLAAGAAAGTIFMQAGWSEKFFSAGQYFQGSKILVAMAVFLGFNLLFLAASWLSKQRKAANWWFDAATLALSASALIAGSWWLMGFVPLSQRPWLMFSYIFLVDAAVTALVLLEPRTAPAQPIAGLGIFVLLAAWTSECLTNSMLNAALVFYLVFAAAHSVFPIVLKKLRGVSGLLWGAQLFPPLALTLVLIPIFRLADLSLLVWPFVLLVDVLAIALAVVTASFAAVLAALVLSLAAIGALISKTPTVTTGLPFPLVLVGAFAVFFVLASVWIVRRFKPEMLNGAGGKMSEDLFLPENMAAQLPILSAFLPFMLLIMATLRLSLANPSPVFGLALLLLVLLLGLTKLFLLEWMPLVGLVCVTALECAWHFNRFDPALPLTPLAWYLVFLAVFMVFPFAFLRRFSDKVPPWAAAALAGVPQFFLVHRLVRAAWPNEVMGLLPAAFAIPPLLGLIFLLKRPELKDKPQRLTLLAWFGATALFFITLIFPIQFERQWLTIAWALEGAALLWLFHRVPHPGLRLAGCGLLAVAFIRLVFNPAVLGYHPRSETPIFNWYLYTYGIVTVCLFVGARLLAPPRDQVFQVKAPPLLAALGTVLAFVLLNIEIADYFSPAGSTLTFQFTGNFARDMTYSIAWALFALGLLVYGIARKVPASRYSGLALLSVTVLKLFLHDLARLGQLYRIGAFIGVAIIAMLASFAYHRFYAAANKAQEVKDETDVKPDI